MIAGRFFLFVFTAMVIYIDVLIAFNIFINFLILLCSAKISGCEKHGIRIVFGSVFAGLCSLIILLDPLNAFASAVVKTGITAVIALISFPFNSVKSFLRNLFSLFFVNFVFAGMMTAVYIFYAPQNMVFSNGTVYFDVNITFLAVSSLICYGFIKLITALLKRYSSAERICRVSVSVGAFTVGFDALIDTGSSLTDCFTNKPVTAVEKNAVSEMINSVTESEYERRSGVIPVKTASGTELLETFRADSMTISAGDKKWKIEKPVLALTKQNLSGGEYRALINEKIFENGRSKNEKSEIKTE